MVVSPEHALVSKWLGEGVLENASEVEEYRKKAASKSDLERTELNKEKTGVRLRGIAGVNPVNGDKLPVFISDYVLASYGTGAIMAVPAHDERDFDFAKVFNLPVYQVVAAASAGKFTCEGGSCRIVYPGSEGSERVPYEGDSAYTDIDDGVMVNSGFITGFSVKEAQKKMIAWLEEKGVGRAKTQYKLRDWLFSRQRYWGEPFPVIHMADGSTRLVDENDLPLTLPELADYKPAGTGEPPLSKATEWVNYKDPATGETGVRETNTMPQWAGSCWYYLRYIDPHNTKAFADQEKLKEWLPVDLYIGGAEHAVLHLLYSRFWHKVLFDLGLVPTDEPFHKLVNQGMILGLSYKDARGVLVPTNEVEWKNGKPFKKGTDEELTEFPAKMSKSLRNVVNPDDVVRDYGADSLRLYEMFMGPLQATKPWSTSGVEGVFRFLKRVWRMFTEQKISDRPLTADESRVLNQTVKKVTADLEALSFNTAISQMMVFVNAFASETKDFPREAAEKFALVLSPFAPHICEELWQMLGHTDTLAYEKWPEYSEAALAVDTVEIPVQVCGKLRARVKMPSGATQDQMKELAASDPNVVKFIQDKEIVRVVCVPGRLVNFVVK